ncbi:hypothetical protein SD71_14165 [Cohnella kolymensis]|uniref:Uncharacterized protein n=2 Tax=Cohnella kolymensis TaxID=1590652 RepID=A0ABR5A475_9BACL|nr:hypothetical protein SD71_14165 [Cohnella kolymensis]
MSGQAQLGYFISAMKRAGLDREQIAKTLEAYDKAYKMPPYKATRIYHDFHKQKKKRSQNKDIE